MLRIDTSDCWLEIGVGRKFTRTLVWHFSRFLRESLPAKCGDTSAAAESIDREARRLANQFIFDMQEYFRRTLGDTYEELDNLSPEGIVDLYVQENLEDFQDDYLREQLPGFSAACDRLSPPMPRNEPTAVIAVATCH